MIICKENKTSRITPIPLLTYNNDNDEQEEIGVMKENQEAKPILFINDANNGSPVIKMQSTFTSEIKNTISAKKSMKQKKAPNINNHTMTEKIDFLSKFPKEIPSVKCEIKTNEKVYVGRIMNERDHLLEIASFGRPSEIIDKREIEEINFVGF